VDYFNRYGRKIFIILGGVLFAFGLFFSAFIDPSFALILFTIFLFISVAGVVFLDVAVDAWAIETSREDERGKISGAMFAGQSFGWAMSSFFFAYIAKNMGYTFVFLIACLLVILVFPFTLLFKERKTGIRPEKMGAIFIGEFRKKTTQLISIFSLILYINIGLLMIVVPLYMKVNLQLEIGHIGAIVAIFPISTAIGSLVGGLATDRFGRKITLFVFIGISIFFSASFIFAYSWQILIILYGIIGFLHGGYLAVNFALLMDVTNPKVGASQFSFLTSLSNAGLVGGNTASGSMVSLLGFSRVFLYSAWFLGLPVLLLYFIKLKKNR
jgi:MFS family permease